MVSTMFCKAKSAKNKWQMTNQTETFQKFCVAWSSSSAGACFLNSLKKIYKNGFIISSFTQKKILPINWDAFFSFFQTICFYIILVIVVIFFGLKKISAVQTLPDTTPTKWKINPFSKMTVTFEPLKQLWCPSGFRRFFITMT